MEDDYGDAPRGRKGKGKKGGKKGRDIMDDDDRPGGSFRIAGSKSKGKGKSKGKNSSIDWKAAKLIDKDGDTSMGGDSKGGKGKSKGKGGKNSYDNSKGKGKNSYDNSKGKGKGKNSWNNGKSKGKGFSRYGGSGYGGKVSEFRSGGGRGWGNATWQSGTKGKGGKKGGKDRKMGRVEGCSKAGEKHKAHDGTINAFCMVGDNLFSVGDDGVAKSWSAEPDEETQKMSLTLEKSIDLESPCKSVVYEQNSQWLFFGLDSGEIKAYNKDGNCLLLKGHEKAVHTLLVHQAILLSGSWDCTFKCWQHDDNTSTFNCVKTIDVGFNIKSMRILGNVLWVAGLGAVKLYDLSNLSEGPKIDLKGEVVLDLLEYSGFMIVVSMDRKVRVFNDKGESTYEGKTLSKNFSLIGMMITGDVPALIIGQESRVGVYEVPDFEPKGEFLLLGKNQGLVRSLFDLNAGNMFVCGTSEGNISILRWKRDGESSPQQTALDI